MATFSLTWNETPMSAEEKNAVRAFGALKRAKTFRDRMFQQKAAQMQSHVIGGVEHQRHLTAIMETRFRCTTTIHCVAFNARADMLAVGTNVDTEIYTVNTYDVDKKTEMVNSESGDKRGITRWLFEPAILLPHSAQQGGLSFAQNVDSLAIAGQKFVTVCDLSSGGTLASFEREARVRCVALSSSGEVLVYGGFDKKVMMIDLGTGTVSKKISNANATETSSGGAVKSTHVSPDGTLLALGCESGSAGACMLYALPSCNLIHRWDHSKVVWVVRLSPDKRMLAACGYDMAMTLYSTVSMEVCAPLSLISRQAMYPACTHMLIVSCRPRLVQMITSIKYPCHGGPAFIWSCTFSSDSRRLAVANWNARTYLYAVESTKIDGSAGKPRTSSPTIDEIDALIDNPDGDTVPATPTVQSLVDDDKITLKEIGVALRADRCYSVDVRACTYRMRVSLSHRTHRSAPLRPARRMPSADEHSWTGPAHTWSLVDATRRSQCINTTRLASCSRFYGSASQRILCTLSHRKAAFCH